MIRSGHFHDEEYIVRDQTTFSPDFDGREVDRGQDVPMGFDEGLPGCLPFTFRSPFDAMFLEDVSNGLVRDLVAQVGQRSGGYDRIPRLGNLVLGSCCS